MKLVVATVLLMASAAVAVPLSDSLSAEGTVPTNTCVDMVPLPGNRPSDNPSPYTITVEPTSVIGRDFVRVRITGSEAFEAVYLQARRGDEPIGKFYVEHNEQIDNIHINHCPPGRNNDMTFVGQPVTSFDIKWISPNIDGEIVFRASIVKTDDEFWVGVESPKVTLSTLTF